MSLFLVCIEIKVLACVLKMESWKYSGNNTNDLLTLLFNLPCRKIADLSGNIFLGPCLCRSPTIFIHLITFVYVYCRFCCLVPGILGLFFLLEFLLPFGVVAAVPPNDKQIH